MVLWVFSRPGDLRFDASVDASLSVLLGSNRTAAGKRRLSSSCVAAVVLASFGGFAAGRVGLQRAVGMRWKGSDSFCKFGSVIVLF